MGFVADGILGQLADELTRALVRAETVIRGRGYGVPAESLIEPGLWLVFGKYDGRWELYLRNDSGDVRELDDATIHVRRLACAAIPGLVQKLEIAANEQLAGMRQEIAELNAYLDRLQCGEP